MPPTHLIGQQYAGYGTAVGQLDLRVQILLPLADTVKGAAARHIKHDEGADGLLVVDTRHIAETLLSGNVPELQADYRIGVPVEHLQGKVNANGGTIVLAKELMYIALDEGRLASAQLPDD